MKKGYSTIFIIAVCFLICFSNIVIAQKEYSVLSAGGNLAGNGTASNSIGQISYQYFYNGSGYINQGVQQPAEWSTKGSTSAPAPKQAQMAIVCAAGDLSNTYGTASYSVGQVGYTYTTIPGYQLTAGIQQSIPNGVTNAVVDKAEVTVETPAEKDGIVVYPNPSNGNFTVRINTSNLTDNAIVTVYDLFGKIVLSSTMGNNGGFMQQTFSNKNLAAGMYVVHCSVGNKSSTLKLSVLR